MSLKLIHEFLFRAGAERFARAIVVALPLYAVFRVWLYDWASYSKLAVFLYRPPGFLALPFPALSTLIALQMLATILGLGVATGRLGGKTLFLFAWLNLLFDYWHNGFGFIEVQIHYVWFLFILSLCPNPGRRSGPVASSFAFRGMELIVVLAYFQSGIAKLIQSGISWASDGTTLQIALLRQGLQIGEWLAQWPTPIRCLSWITLIFELSFLFYYAFPRLRWIWLTTSVGFHLGTWLFLGIDFSHLWIFAATVLIAAPELVNLPRSRPLILKWPEVCKYLTTRAC